MEVLTVSIAAPSQFETPCPTSARLRYVATSLSRFGDRELRGLKTAHVTLGSSWPTATTNTARVCIGRFSPAGMTDASSVRELHQDLGRGSAMGTHLLPSHSAIFNTPLDCSTW